MMRLINYHSDYDKIDYITKISRLIYHRDYID